MPAPAPDAHSGAPVAANPPVAPVSNITDAVSPDQSATKDTSPSRVAGVPNEVARKIIEAQNVLVALSSDPSVDEMAAAIGLSLFLDKLGKRATAIYSGSTPNALEFLKPEETFETTADALQDFVIAINKDKADHLRYKLDGEYVKIFITPYKTRVSEEDLDFSYGDFNVDLVLALDVANGIDLDAALREHGRIMHDAAIINITAGNPGKFGEIEWSDNTASSVSEMIAKLLYSNLSGEVKIEKDEATALLTGIIAATNRFSNAKTTPETMQISSRLMKSGANQQLISKNITPDINGEVHSFLDDDTPKQNNDSTELDITHGNGEDAIDTTDTVEPSPKATEESSALLDDLKAAEASLAQTGSETVPDTSNQPVRIETSSISPLDIAQPTDEALSSVIPELNSTISPASSLATPEIDTATKPAPLSFTPSVSAPSTTATDSTMDTEKEIINQPEKVIQPTTASDATSSSNPASMMTPSVPSAPEINGIPEINYMPMPGEEILPPPPTPPIDMSSATPAAPADLASPITPIAPADPVTPAQPPAQPASSTLPPLGPQPAMQDQVYTPQASNPGAFKIPGM